LFIHLQDSLTETFSFCAKRNVIRCIRMIGFCVVVFSHIFCYKNLKRKSAILKCVSKALTETSQIEFPIEGGCCSANLGNVPITTVKATKRSAHCTGKTYRKQPFESRLQLEAERGELRPDWKSSRIQRLSHQHHYQPCKF